MKVVYALMVIWLIGGWIFDARSRKAQEADDGEEG